MNTVNLSTEKFDKNVKELGSLSKIPNDLFIHLLEYLDTPSLRCVSKINKSYKDIAFPIIRHRKDINKQSRILRDMVDKVKYILFNEWNPIREAYGVFYLPNDEYDRYIGKILPFLLKEITFDSLYQELCNIEENAFGELHRNTWTRKRAVNSLFSLKPSFGRINLQEPEVLNQLALKISTLQFQSFAIYCFGELILLHPNFLRGKRNLMILLQRLQKQFMLENINKNSLNFQLTLPTEQVQAFVMKEIQQMISSKEDISESRIIDYIK